MAEKTILELTQATEITDSDLFVLQQGDTAKKLLGSTLKDYITISAADKAAIAQIVLAELPTWEGGTY